MGVAANILVAIAGFLLGMQLVARIGRWLVTCYLLFRPEAGQPRPPGPAAVFATLFGSGFWLTIAAGVIFYYAASHNWAVPLQIGTLLGAVATVFATVRS